MNSENPYAPPSGSLEPIEVVEVDKNSREYLRKVAKGQRNVLLAILFQIGFVVANMATSGLQQKVPGLVFVMGLIGICMLVFVVVSVFRLAAIFHGTIGAMLYVIGTVLPCFGLILLLILSQKATDVLSRAGIKVGMLGVNPNSI